MSRIPFRARRTTRAVATDRAVYFFGGIGSQGTESVLDIADDVWRYEPDGNEWTNVRKTDPWPLARRYPGVAAFEGGAYVWGGSGIAQTPDGGLEYDFKDDMWWFDFASEGWEPIEQGPDGDRKPGARYAPLFERVGDAAILFGGYTETGSGEPTYLGETWVWDPTDGWERPGDVDRTPKPRYAPMAAADGDRVYVYGGVGESQYGDVWRLDVPEMKWTRLWDGPGNEVSPTPRYGALLTVHDGALVLFGGRSATDPKRNYSDLWRFHLDTARWERIHGGTDAETYATRRSRPAYHAKSATARIDDGVFLLGGEGRHGHVSDFWRLDVASMGWEQLARAREDDPELW